MSKLIVSVFTERYNYPISLCKKLTDKPLLVRLDSGNDSIDNVAVLIDTGCSFIIKRNLRKENKEEWFQMAKTY